MSDDLDLLIRCAAERLAERDRGSCPEDARWLELYGGGVDGVDPAGAEALRDHLAACPRCLELARHARRFVDAREAGPAAGGEARRGWTPVGLAAAVALAVGAALLLPPRTPERLEKAAWVPAPAPAATTVYRDAEGLDPEVEESFRTAMAPYQRDDFAGAERTLADHLARHPHDQRARFYRGVSLLLGERARDAEALLADVARLASPGLAAEARWYRALALLRLDERDAAAAELATLAAGESPRRAEATRRLETLGTR
jgi:hypothetical protein